MDSEPVFIAYQQRINQVLADLLPVLDPCKPLHEAMHYAVLGGGKRIRSLLVYTLGETLGLPLESLDSVACSVELLHAYSLIHDDLPMMDNDDWRRGKPSCHRRFGEALALLAGDALQALAFGVLLKAPLYPRQIVKMLTVLTKAAGVWGMVGGQAMEFSMRADLNRSMVETIHRLKTGALFAASLKLPGIMADLSPEILSTLAQIGSDLGLVYQIQDDIADNEVKYSQDLIGSQDDLESAVMDAFNHLEALFPPHQLLFKQLLSFMFSVKLIDKIYY